MDLGQTVLSLKKKLTMKNYLKVVISIFVACLFFVGCSKKDNTNGTAKVNVHVNDFTITQEDMPSKDSPASYNGVKGITLAFYASDGTEQYKETQLKSDPSNYTTFGDFSFGLPMGSYTMVVLGYGKDSDDDLVLTSPTQAEYTGAHARETFVVTQAVDITSTNAVNLSATLSRVVAKLIVRSTDNRTENASNVRMTFAAGGKAFNPTTGLATTNAGFSNTVGISSAVGASSNSISYLFLSTDQQTMNVSLDVLNSEGNSISHKEVSNVPFQRNHVTKLTGSLYTAGSVTGGFEISTAWESDTNIVNF